MGRWVGGWSLHNNDDMNHLLLPKEIVISVFFDWVNQSSTQWSCSFSCTHHMLLCNANDFVFWFVRQGYYVHISMKSTVTMAIISILSLSFDLIGETNWQATRWIFHFNLFHFEQITIIKHCGLGSEYIRPDRTYSMLSRYNGIGSLKLSIGATNNQRTSNPCISEVTRMDITTHRNDITDSTYGELPSIHSPKKLNSIRKLSKINHHGTNDDDINDLKVNKSFIFNRKSANNRQKHNTNAPNTAVNGKLPKTIPKITSTNSIYSTSTISNSSLQEYVDNELDTTELAKYMRQINKEINHESK